MRRAVSFGSLSVIVAVLASNLPACSKERNFDGGSAENAAGSTGTSSGGKSSSGGKAGEDTGGTDTGGTDTGGTDTGGNSSGGAPSAGGGQSSGGSGTNLAPLGTSCEENAECNSGECSSGVCCESECDGVCETCDASGQCVAAETDSACPAVTCTAGNNECLNYGSAIEGGSCRSQGACKTAEDCHTPKAKNTPCSLSDSTVSYCDGKGECVQPTVACGTSSCTIGDNVCCFRRDDGIVSLTCGAVSECDETPFDALNARTPVECDEHADCRTGFLCSLLSASGGSNIKCRDASRTDVEGAQHDGTYVNNYEVCASPTMPERACHNGKACEESIPGWKTCAQ